MLSSSYLTDKQKGKRDKMEYSLKHWNICADTIMLITQGHLILTYIQV